MRHPRIALTCWSIARNERCHGAADYAQRRANELASPDPRLVDRGDGVQVDVHRMPVADGGDTIEVSVYRTAGDQPRPVHVHLHGGGFCYGSGRGLDVMARELAIAGLVVVLPEYRLAPEHPWPAAVDDALDVVRWVGAEADQLGADPGSISLGGTSAGGCAAAAASLKARDQGGPALVAVLLDIPVIDLTMSSGRSMDRYATGYLLTRAHLAESYALYVPDPAGRSHPYASPLLAPDLTGLPPAIVLTAEYDPLRDEGEEYAQRLRAAGVPVEVVRARGHVHSSTHTPLPSAVRYRAWLTAMLTRAHGLAAAR